MKKLLFIIIMLLTSITLVKALDVKDVPITDYVNDYSHVLTPETKEYILNKSRQLESACGAQIVVVTIPSLEGKDLEGFTHDLYVSVKLGDKEKKNGLLILLVTEDRLLRVEVGSGLEGVLPDGKVGRFEDNYMIPSLKSSNWDLAIKTGYDAFFNEVVKEYNLDLETATLPQTSSSLSNKTTAMLGIFMASLFIFPGALGAIRHGKDFGLIDIIFLIIFFIPAIVLWIMRNEVFAMIAFFLGGVGTLFFFITRFGENRRSGSRGGWHSGGCGSSGCGSSGGGFSGGGGCSSGGGASRSF